MAPYDAAQPVVIAAHLPPEPPQSVFRNIIVSFCVTVIFGSLFGIAAFITASKTELFADLSSIRSLVLVHSMAY